MTSGSLRVVGVGGDLPLEGLLVGALEVPQAFRAGLADAGVLVLLFDDVGTPLGRDPRQGQLLAEDRGQLVHGQLDFEDVVPGCIAGRRCRPRRRSSGRSGVPTSPGPWPTPPRFLVP